MPTRHSYSQLGPPTSRLDIEGDSTNLAHNADSWSIEELDDGCDLGTHYYSSRSSTSLKVGCESNGSTDSWNYRETESVTLEDGLQTPQFPLSYNDFTP
ncbi:hypothetical protein BHE74_00022134 [Ensete ventricosum]|nr:hypothetical protein BHE74_00022134 [Ensete ventricosum]